MTKLSTKLILASAASLVALAAHAQSQTVQPGPYIGGSIGTTRFHGPDVGDIDTDKTDTGGKVYGGYQFTPNFSLEGGYVGLGKYSSSASELKLNNGVFLDAVGTLPVAQDFSLLGRVGVYNGKADRTINGVNDSERGTDVKYGAGVQYDLSKNTAIRGEWERYRVKALDIKENTDLFSVGVNYRF